LNKVVAPRLGGGGPRFGFFLGIAVGFAFRFSIFLYKKRDQREKALISVVIE
jgi:hypothetical protein